MRRRASKRTRDDDGAIRRTASIHRRYTKEPLDEFERLLERQSDKIDRIERERITAEAELTARIEFSEGRLHVSSEKALHLAVADIAAGYVRRAEDGDATKRLPDGT